MRTRICEREIRAVVDVARPRTNSHRVTMITILHKRLWINWTSPVSICPRTGNGRLPTSVPHPGTCCLTISRTLIYLFKLSNVILRHSYFPHTSTFSVFDVSYETRYINSLLLLLLLTALYLSLPSRITSS